MANSTRPEPDPAAFPSEGLPEEQARFLLQYAVLAPSSHNSQPWLFAVEDDEIRIYADGSRQLSVADPDGRELDLSVGCALENLTIAAAQFGFGTDVEYASRSAEQGSDGEQVRHAVTVRLDRDAAGDVGREPALFEAITDRRTNHRPFEERAVPEPILDRFVDDADAAGLGVELIADSTRRETVAALQTRADECLFERPEYRAELGHWIGTGSLGANWLAARIGEVAVRHLDLGSREARTNSTLLTSAPVIVVLTAPSEQRETRLETGRLFERMALTATSEGLATHPMSQILEVEACRADLVELLDLAESVPLHLFRLGYAGPDSTRTPRRPVEERLL